MVLTIEMAREWYPSADPVHGFDHVLRVYRLAEQIALAEGGNIEIVRAAVLLHDTQFDRQRLLDIQVSGSGAETPREDHHHVSAEFARQVLEREGWGEQDIEAVQHCIRAHRFRDDREQPQTLEAKIVFDADKLDAIGAIGVARAIAYAVSHGQPVYSPPSEDFLLSGELRPAEPHSSYHEYLFKLRYLKDRLFTRTGRAIAEDRHAFMQSYFENLVNEV